MNKGIWVANRQARKLMDEGVMPLVVGGDLSQALGSPVEKGRVLFQVAPPDA